MNVILIGYRATGKTTVGKQVAERLCCPFYDTDEEVERTTGKTVLDLVAEGGWGLFREKERSAISGLSLKDGCVFALGGGAILEEENVRLLRRNGVFVWLMSDAGTIVERMRRDEKSRQQRPSLTGKAAWEEVPAMLQWREEAYKKIAHFTVDTVRRNIEEVSLEVLRVLGERLKSEVRGQKSDSEGKKLRR